MNRPSPAILRKLIRRHKGNLSAIQRSLEAGTDGLPPIAVTRQGVSYWMKEAGLSDLAMSLRPPGSASGRRRTIDAERIQQAIATTATYSQAADQLGVSLTTLYRWLRTMYLTPAHPRRD